MNKTEFMDLLRYYFRNISKADLEEILADYETHFEEGRQRGLSEEAICKELGSPKAVYEMYLNEGMLEERSGASREDRPLSDAAEKLAGTAGKLASGAETLAARAQTAWTRDIAPRVPGAAGTASSLLLRTAAFACFMLSGLILLATALVVYLLSGSFPMPGGFDPLPGLSLLTLSALAGTGFFASLSLFFLGREIRKYNPPKMTPPAGHGAAGSSSAPAEDPQSAPEGRTLPILETPAGAAGK